MQHLLTTNELAQVLRVSNNHIRKLAERNELPSIQVKGCRRFDLAVVLRQTANFEVTDEYVEKLAESLNDTGRADE